MSTARGPFAPRNPSNSVTSATVLENAVGTRNAANTTTTSIAKSAFVGRWEHSVAAIAFDRRGQRPSKTDREPVGSRGVAVGTAGSLGLSGGRATGDGSRGCNALRAVYPNTWHGETIRVSEEYHEWLTAHKRDDETMEETLRRMTRGPHPSDVAGLLSDAEVEDAKAAVERLRGRDRDRLDAARNAFENEDAG
ncbi:hypothetical protein [Halomarina halobia]